MKRRMTDKQIKRFHRLLSAEMLDFDCGELCAPGNDGVPVCCENEYVVPVLFVEEFKWHRSRDYFWHKMRPISKTIEKFIEESEDYYVFGSCPGHDDCERSKRSFSCMTFPFDPHLDREGNILGLAYNNSGIDCPLMKRSGKIYKSRYIKNSITYWKELFELYPEEKENYMDESRKRERKAKREGKKVKIIKPG